MTTLTLIEQLQQSPKWAEFEKWYKEQSYEIPLYDTHPHYDNDPYKIGFVELPFEFQVGVFEKFIQSRECWIAKARLQQSSVSDKRQQKYSEFDGTFEELLIYYFNLPSYWEWYWGTDLNDLTKHSEKIKFTDFNEMKNFSAKHAYSCEHLKPNYWSSYDVIEI